MSRIRKNKPYDYRGVYDVEGEKKKKHAGHFRVQLVAIFDLAKIATVSRSLWSARNCKKKKRPLVFTFCCNNFFLAWQLIIGDETIILVQSTLFPLHKLQRSLTIIFNRKYVHCLDWRLTFPYMVVEDNSKNVNLFISDNSNAVNNYLKSKQITCCKIIIKMKLFSLLYEIYPTFIARILLIPPRACNTWTIRVQS